MSIAPRHGSRPGQAGKSGSPSSSSITLTTGPAWRQRSGASTPASAAVRSGSAFESTARARSSSPPSSTTPARAAVLDEHSLDRRDSTHTRAPAASAAERSAAVTAPMPPRA